MNSALLLALVMIVGVVIAFAILHTLARRIPFEQAVPRERFRWPVWNWYPILVVTALVFTLSFAVYHAGNKGGGRTADDLSAADEMEAEQDDFELVSGKDRPKPSPVASPMTTKTAGTP